MPDRSAVKAACPLEGGGVSEGSTCGVVSGGCLALVMAHLGDLLEEDGGRLEALYQRMRGYTAWFEESFGSTLCRDRCGADLRKASGFADYVLTGKVLTRCVNHIGRAVEKLIGLVNEPLEAGESGGETRVGDEETVTPWPKGREEGEETLRGGYCAAPVLRRVREAVGTGGEVLEKISMGLDGGVGLSGGLCGAPAGALLALGTVWGIDPREEGVVGTLRFFVRGHLNLYAGKGKRGLWAVGVPLMRDFRRRFGSLECRDLTGRTFHSLSDLEGYIAGSERCEEIRLWCAENAVEILS